MEKYSIQTTERKNILETFLDRNVIVDIERYRVSGKLLSFQEADKSSHKPVILPIYNATGLHMVRDNWRILKKTRSGTIDRKTRDTNWNEVTDLDKNGKTDILDIATVAKDYGKKVQL